MKGILVILDGMGDLPQKQLGDKTPLEAADTKNLDFLATRGEMGFMYPVKPGFVPGSVEAIVSIFGNEILSSTRGQLEANGANIKLERGDLAFRANFATIDSLDKGNILDRRAGRTLTTAEAVALANTINRKITLPCKFLFQPTIQHRAVLVFKGGFSDNITGNDFTYVQGKTGVETKVGHCKPKDDDENSQYTANVVNEFLEKAFVILNNHPINEERKKLGLLPANYFLVRGAGIELPKLKPYKGWVSAAYMPLEIGFAKTCGMENFSFEYPKLKKLDAYENMYEGLKKACDHAINIIKKNHDKFNYAYIHIKETDLPGHDNKPLEKKTMIEYVDKTLFDFLRKFAPQKGIKIVVTADHSTPCRLKTHSADPVPVLFFNGSIPKEKHFSEKEARKGTLGSIQGQELLRLVGFDK
ncbi:2,3-bisphosphoglycerate-independent phosphoglycerate mutase (Phosphoglyceromutase) [sediment metagenome]|uniref:2,3-bisphosphoglycerate-independent phosphoglycerate mutase (Phosphoglyceromutase) n=1 Tax=sediment metagenome TaxID=749907 RepID=D9PEW1_9ZZZZ